MYRTIIDINPGVSPEVLGEIKFITEAAFDNRAGKVENISNEPYRFIFEGNERHFGCLQLGNLALNKNKELKNRMLSWKWEDEEPDESCDLLVEFAKPVY